MQRSFGLTRGCACGVSEPVRGTRPVTKRCRIREALAQDDLVSTLSRSLLDLATPPTISQVSLAPVEAMMAAALRSGRDFLTDILVSRIGRGHWLELTPEPRLHLTRFVAILLPAAFVLNRRALGSRPRQHYVHTLEVQNAISKARTSREPQKYWNATSLLRFSVDTWISSSTYHLKEKENFEVRKPGLFDLR